MTIKEKIIIISDEILNYILEYRKSNPEFTCALRSRDSVQSKEVRLEAGQWFQGSHYLYFPLFKKGDNARKIKTLGFVFSFNKDSTIKENYIEISFKSGSESLEDQRFHIELADKLGISLNDMNHGRKLFSNPNKYIENLEEYLNSVRPIALELIKKYNLEEAYVVNEKVFLKRLKNIQEIKKKLSTNNNYVNSGSINMFNDKPPLNQILFGPPGTGKTYNSIIKAVKIIEPSFDITKGWDSIKNKYDELVVDKQIMFITFHQSMNYEDFIEGIKPDSTDSDSSISYRVQDGIFKKICKLSSPKFGNFGTVIESFKQEVSEADGKKPLTIIAKGTTFDIIYRGTPVFYVQPHASSKEIPPWYPVNIENIEKTFTTGSSEGVYNPTYVREIIKYLVDNKGLKHVANNSNNNYVLIIDEINRGNVSSIFGELITLIEDSKRQGSKEALEITLPYSKKKFSVPDNLYIIGTMNTADRSVEALDSALRRRFNFTEMPPKPDLIETEGNKIRYIEPNGAKIDLVELLQVINSRLEILLDKDHLIGHSYFMKVKTLTGLKSAFCNEIIPLLQEYFFGDYGKITMVLGEGFCKGKKASNDVKFATTTNDYDESDYLDKQIYHFPSLENNKFFIKAINQLLNKQGEKEQ